ncbi:MAG: hypothetical protein CL808_01925 [Citromicrobium sp.]|nr:hypothetical protein [Citromicrobium sp.]
MSETGISWGWKRWAILAVVLLASAVAVVLLVDRTTRAGAIVEEQRAAHDEASILAASLTSELDKFSLLPLALAKDPQVAALVGGTYGDARALDRRLQTLASQSHAAAIYVMDRKGHTLAASNWHLPTSSSDRTTPSASISAMPCAREPRPSSRSAR